MIKIYDTSLGAVYIYIYKWFCLLILINDYVKLIIIDYWNIWNEKVKDELRRILNSRQPLHLNRGPRAVLIFFFFFSIAIIFIPRGKW